MKLHVLSDLHIEFGDFTLPETDADVIVLAGDIGVGMGGLEWIERQCIDKPIIYVPGNHEFYKHDINIIDELKKMASKNLYVLNNDMLVIDGVRFIGSILWTDFMLFGSAEKYFSVHNAKDSMSDFSLITHSGKRFMPEDSIRLHEESRNWMECMLSESFQGNTVVVTHHAPSSSSVPARFSNSLLTPAFASNLEHMMGDNRVALWIHGHTHDSFNYEVCGTRVVCNPRGYVLHELSRDFDPDFVISV